MWWASNRQENRCAAVDSTIAMRKRPSGESGCEAPIPSLSRTICPTAGLRFTVSGLDHRFKQFPWGMAHLTVVRRRTAYQHRGRKFCPWPASVSWSMGGGLGWRAEWSGITDCYPVDRSVREPHDQRQQKLRAARAPHVIRYIDSGWQPAQPSRTIESHRHHCCASGPRPRTPVTTTRPRS